MGKERTGFAGLSMALSMALFVVLVLIVWGASVAVAQEQQQKPGNATSQSPLQSPPEVLFAIGEWPPMITENMVGYGTHTQRVTSVFEAMGYRVKYVFLPWRRAYEKTQSGEYVATFSWIWTEERDGLVLYPRYPIARAHQKGFYKKSRFPNGLPIYDIVDIKSFGVRPVGIASYWYEEVFHRHNIQADMVTTSDVAWRFLDADRADIFFEEEDVGWQDMARVLGDDAMKRYATTNPVQSDNMFILFSNAHPMGGMLRDAFDAFMETPKGREICEEWGVCERAVKIQQELAQQMQ